jgi:hypothetical protein
MGMGKANVVVTTPRLGQSEGKCHLVQCNAYRISGRREPELAEQIVRAGNRPRMGRRGAGLSALDNPSRRRRSKIVENPLSSLSIDSLSGRRGAADLCCQAIL